jgi:peptidyl-tRNA hydrolase
MENGHFWTLAVRPDARISKGSRMAQSNCAAVEKYTSERSTKNCRKHLNMTANCGI